MLSLALALQLLATAPGAMPGATPVAPGAPRFVQIASLTGVPADSAAQEGFGTAFRSVFAEESLPGEHESGGSWRGGLPLPNHFRLLEGDVASDAWQVQVSIGAPPPLQVPDPRHKGHVLTIAGRRMSRGMRVGAVVSVPSPSGAVDHTFTVTASFAFPAKGDGRASLAVPQNGYVFPWDDAGHVAGLLVLEALHRESRDFVATERVDITPAVRTDAGR